MSQDLSLVLPRERARESPRWTALLWLDWWLFVNRVRTIGRNPRRLIPWLLFTVWLIPSFFTRLTVGSRLRAEEALPALAPQLSQLSVLVPGLALLAVGVSVWRASATPPAAFQSAADARFVIGAGFNSRAVFAWLSLRTARRLILSFALMLVFFQVVYLPFLGLGFWGALSFTLAVAIFGGIVFGARLVAFTLQRAAPAVPVGAIGLLATVAGAAAFLAALANLTGTVSVPSALLSINAALPPGGWMVQAFGGGLAGQLDLLAAAVALTAAGIALAGDCYPELWGASARVIAVRQAMGERGGLFAYVNAGSAASRRARRAQERSVQSVNDANVPRGALAVFWKEWLAVRRGRGGLELQVVLLAGGTALGILMGAAMGQGSRLAGLVASIFIVLAIFSSWAAGVQLGRDLGNPLWWLSSSALASRLVVWSLARALRFAVPLIAFSVAGLVAYGQFEWALPVAVLAPLLLCWMSQTVGLGVYAFLPAKTDYRLAMMLRMLAIYVITLPLAFSFLPGLLLHNPALAVSLPLGIIAAVIVATILFANWRIDGNGLMYAREERQ